MTEKVNARASQEQKNRLLVLGLQQAPREELARRLTAAGHQVFQAESVARTDHYRVDLVILHADKREELVSGCGAVRRHPSLKGLPLLAVIPEPLCKEADFSAGMDDLLLSPWRPSELFLRVNLSLWRKDRTGSPRILKRADLLIDLANYSVRLRGETLDLTLKEYELLCYLASHPGQVFTRAALLNSVWGYEYFGGTRTVDVHIRRLRAKLGDWGEQMIQTVRGVGYRFAAG